MRNAIRGSVYIEARSERDVQEILEGLMDVLRNGGFAQKELVDIDERISLLTMLGQGESSLTSTSACLGSQCWIEVKSHTWNA